MMQAISILQKGFHPELRHGEFVKGNSFKHFFCPSFHTKEIRKVAQFVEQHLGWPDALPLADALIRKYPKEKFSLNLDRAAAPHRENLSYLHPKNKKFFQKWLRASQPPEVFRDHPKFAQFLEASRILGQIKVTRDTTRIIDGKPALLVNGEWVPEDTLYERFEIANSKIYRRTFVIEKKSRLVYTYLDNGKGLEPHHPFLTENHPISTLNEEDYQKVWNKACEFIRPEEQDLSPEERAEQNQNRPFILQIVTPTIKKEGTNFSKFLCYTEHCYVRLIIGKDNPELGTRKGEVYGGGYVRGFFPLVPLYTLDGRFQTPDPWESKEVEERLVTNIPVSQESAHNVYQFILKLHRDATNLGIRPGFHLTQHNCAVFCKEVCRAAGITLPTEMGFIPALTRICPDCIRKVGAQIAAWTKAAAHCFSRLLHRILPQKVFTALHWIAERINRLVNRIFEAIIALSITPFRAGLGELSGQGGRTFQNPNRNFAPPLHNLKNFVTYPKMSFPAVIQDWQRKQASTVHYDNYPVKLTIVPSS